MSVRPQIPAVEGVQDKQVAGILGPIKMILESITGRLPNRPQIKALGSGTTIASIINKVNEIIGRIQDSDVGRAADSTTQSGIGTRISNALIADVALSNAANYFDGPSIQQGSSGTWYVSGKVTVADSSTAAGFAIKLWDGSTVIDSARVDTSAAVRAETCTLSGFIQAPVGNIRISVRDLSSTNGAIQFNNSGNSMDSTISAFRLA